jgi:hypothetical protein
VPPEKYSAVDVVEVTYEGAVHDLLRRLFEDMLSQDGGVRFNVISIPSQTDAVSILFPRVSVSTAESGQLAMWTALTLSNYDAVATSMFPATQQHQDSVTVRDDRLLNAALLEQHPWLHVFCEEWVLEVYRHAPLHLKDTSTATLQGTGPSDQEVQQLIKEAITTAIPTRPAHDSKPFGSGGARVSSAVEAERWSQFYLALRASLRATEGPFSDIINAALGVSDLYPSPLVSNSQVYVSNVSALPPPPRDGASGPAEPSNLPLPSDDLLLCHTTRKRARYFTHPHMCYSYATKHHVCCVVLCCVVLCCVVLCCW